MVQSERMDREEIRLLRWRLQQTEQDRDRLREERDRLRETLQLARTFAEENFRTQADTTEGVIDGAWLSNHIKDVLEGKE